MFQNIPSVFRGSQNLMEFWQNLMIMFEKKVITGKDLNRTWVSYDFSTGEKEILLHYLTDKIYQFQGKKLQEKAIILQILKLFHDPITIPLFLDFFHDNEPPMIRYCAYNALKTYSLEKLLIPLSQNIINTYPLEGTANDNIRNNSMNNPIWEKLTMFKEEIKKIAGIVELSEIYESDKLIEGSLEEFLYYEQIKDIPPNQVIDNMLGEEILEFQANMTLNYNSFQEHSLWDDHLIPGRYEWILLILIDSQLNIHEIRKLKKVTPEYLIQIYFKSPSKTLHKLILAWNVLALPALQVFSQQHPSFKNQAHIDAFISEIYQKNSIRLKNNFDLAL